MLRDDGQRRQIGLVAGRYDLLRGGLFTDDDPRLDGLGRPFGIRLREIAMIGESERPRDQLAAGGQIRHDGNLADAPVIVPRSVDEYRRISSLGLQRVLQCGDPVLEIDGFVDPTHFGSQRLEICSQTDQFLPLPGV